MKLSLVLCAFLVSSLFSSMTRAEEFPKHVYFKDQTQSFSPEYEYVLNEGKIWIRPNPKTVGYAGQWKLFQGTGVPFGEKAKSFKDGDSIVSFSTEGLMIVAVSNRGRVYYWQSTNLDPQFWQDEMGAPFEDSLFMPPHKDWTFSFSVRPHPGQYKTDMKELNTYFEDRFGERIQFGLTATTYVLDEDGQHIRYIDTGLPSSFHKVFTTPERGRFVAERLTASGSTLFVIDKSGKMYTVMHDYEINGACPAQVFTYVKTEQDAPREDGNLIVMKAKRGLPILDWRLQPAIEITGKAELTTRITIIMIGSGQGNAARELRVQGRDAEGNYGYYYKPIFADTWAFQVTGDEYDHDVVVARDAEHVQGEALDHYYKGVGSQIFSDDIQVELLDFYKFNLYSTLRVTLPSGKKFDMNLYFFDSWSMTEQMKENVAYVGTVQGEPKMLHATLSIPEELLNSTDPEVSKVINEYFRRFHHVHSAFYVTANDRDVEISSKWLKKKSFRDFSYKFRKILTLKFSRELSEAEQARVVDHGFLYLANLKELMLESAAADCNVATAQQIQAVIARNEAMIREVKRINLRIKGYHLTQGLANVGALAVFYPLDVIINVFGISKKNDDLAGASLTGSQSFLGYARMNLKFAFKDTGDYDQALSIMKTRISGLQTLLKQK